MEHIEQFPPGPLDEYRKRATFDWKKMKILMQNERYIKLNQRMNKLMESNPLFAHTHQEDSLPDYRKITHERLKYILENDFLDDDDKQNPIMQMYMYLILSMFDSSLAIKLAVGYQLFSAVIRSIGTKRHRHFLSQMEKHEISGCFALTEMSHGSNSKRIETIATYDSKTQEFILHSPTIESTKVWIGNLGQSATHSVLFAQLYTPDNICHGLHIFIVPIRNPKTLLPYPGVIVGDMGLKAGLNGLDNGFVLFNQYKIPRENLLNRYADVSIEGKYISSIKDTKTRMGTLFGSLSFGRVFISNMCTKNMQKSMAISIRYSAVRKQFGPSLTEEMSIIEYQTQQWRLFPFLAATYVLTHFTEKFLDDYLQFSISFAFNEKTAEMINQAMEYHALSCGIKSLSGWLARDAIQESREACGGHGYLNASGLGILRNDNDANCTYEGDNNVLLQQVSNYLLNAKKQKNAGEFQPSKTSSIDILNHYDKILKEKLYVHQASELLNLEVVMNIYSWLLCKLLQRSSEKFNFCLSQENSTFYARNNSQIYYCYSLSKIYIEHTMLESFFKFTKNINDIDISRILQQLGCLYGLWRLQNYIGLIYEGEYCNKMFSSLVEEAILKLCLDLKDNAVALVDVLAPSDLILNSVLGKSDGQIYKNIYYEFMNNQKNIDIFEPKPTFMQSKI